MAKAQPKSKRKQVIKSANLSSRWLTGGFCGLMAIGIILVAMIRPTDPDMGWHIRNGLDILRFGAPRGDLYSYTMFGHPWISHEWLTDIGMYWLSHNTGWLIMSAVFASIVALAYVIAARVSRANWETVLITALLAILVAMPIIGIRAQMLTLLGLAIVLWILFRWRERPTNNLIWWLVPLMLLWVNLHGGFFAGLVLIAVFAGAELFKCLLNRFFKKLQLPCLSLRYFGKLGGVWLALVAVTFINPYTWRVYDELRRTLFDNTVRQVISEWTPVSFASPQSYNLLIYTILLAFLVIIYWRRVDLTKVIIGICFFLLAMSSWRNLPLFSLVTVPLLAEIVVAVAPMGFNYLNNWLMIILLAAGVGWLGWDRYQLIAPFSRQPELFQSGGRYPYQAVQYIKEHQLAGKLFNEYNWGGYLIWQLPEKQVFIDGRMATWKTPTQDIFAEYNKISDVDAATGPILDKYDVGLVLIYNNRKSKGYFLGHAEQWKLLYQDDLAMIFQRSDLVTIRPSS